MKANPIEKIIRKLDHPPAGPNWVRFASDDPSQSVKALLNFVRGRPTFTYVPAYVGIKDGLELGISRDTAVTIARTRGAAAGRESNQSLVEAFFDFDESRRFARSTPIEFEREYFRVSREVVVPVAPLSIIRERGKFVPIFVCGWASLPLTLHQRRLLVTVCEDAFLSLTDFQESPAEYLFFPKIECDDGLKKRKPEVWKRGDYKLLSDSELREVVENFIIARAEARRILQLEAAMWVSPKKDEPPPSGGLPF